MGNILHKMRKLESFGTRTREQGRRSGFDGLLGVSMSRGLDICLTGDKEVIDKKMCDRKNYK